MYDSVVSATLTALGGVFIGAILSKVYGVAEPILKNGSASGMQSAQTVISYLDFAFGQFPRAVLLSALLVLLARGIVESEVRA